MNNLLIIPSSPFGPIFPSLLADVRFTQFICKAIRNLVARIINAVLALFRRRCESVPQTTQPEILKESGLLTDIPEGKDNPLSKKIDPSFSKELTDSYIDPQTGDFQKGRLFFELAKDFLRRSIPLINGAPSDQYSQSSSLIKLKIILQKKLKEFGLSNDEIKVIIDEIRKTSDPQNQKPCIDSLLCLIQELEHCTKGDKSLILKTLSHLYQAAFAQMRISSIETHVAWEVNFFQRTETAPGVNGTYSYNLIMNDQSQSVEILSSYLTLDELRNEQARVHFNARIDLQTGIAEIFNYRDPITEI